MTNSTHSAGPTGRRPDPVCVSDPGELLAAIPALLGFRPECSLVVLSLGGRQNTDLIGVMRHDLVCTETSGPSPTMLAAIEQFAVLFDSSGAQAAVAVVVDDAAGDHADAHRDLVDALAAGLAGCGVELIGAYAATDIAAGLRWWSLVDDRFSGTMADPECSPVAVAHVLAGKQIHRSRADLSGLIAVREDESVEVAAQLAAAADSAELEWSLAVGRGDRVGYGRRKLDLVLRQVRAVGAGERLLAQESAELAIALQDIMVRDALLALTACASADAAEQLWLRLVRTLPDPERADAATLLAYSAYARGDGTFAGIVIDAALASDPEHGLARLVEGALRSGVPPERMQWLAEIGRRRACELGVELPVDEIRPV